MGLACYGIGMLWHVMGLVVEDKPLDLSLSTVLYMYS